MAITLPRYLATDPLGLFATQNRNDLAWKISSPTVERIQALVEPEPTRAPPSTPTSTPKPCPPPVAPVTTSASPVASSTTHVSAQATDVTPLVPHATLAPPVVTSTPTTTSTNPTATVPPIAIPYGIRVRTYSQPGAPRDWTLFICLWHAHIAHGKLGGSLRPSPELGTHFPDWKIHHLSFWINRLGGYNEFNRNPRLWNKAAFCIEMIQSEDQDDWYAKAVVGLTRRIGEEWLLPFEQYCTDWPRVPELEKERLLYILGKNFPSHDLNAVKPWNEGVWPPASLDPLSRVSAPCVGVRLCERNEFGHPIDYATCFYMMKLWDLYLGRPMLAPPFPPDINRKPVKMDCYIFNSEIDKLPGGLSDLANSPGGWNRLAFGMNLIEREDQDDARSRMVVKQLEAYLLDYVARFEEFCDEWAKLEKLKKSELVATLMSSLMPIPEPKGKAREVYTNLNGLDPATELALWTNGMQVPLKPLEVQSVVDLYGCHLFGIPLYDPTFNFFCCMWFLSAKPPCPPAWKEKPAKLNLKWLRGVIHAFGGPPAMQRFPQLWAEIAYFFKLATRAQRDTPHIKTVIESLQFIVTEWLLPFERFCTSWSALGLEEKTEHVRRLVAYLKRAKPDHPLPLFRSEDGLIKVQTTALEFAKNVEQLIQNFDPDKSFEEKIKRLHTLPMEEAEKCGMRHWVMRFQRAPLSDEVIRILSDALAGQPSSSKPLEVLAFREIKKLPNTTDHNTSLRPHGAAQPNLWDPETIKNTNSSVQMLLKRINDSRKSYVLSGSSVKH
ncbi:hypothetical protein FRC12_006133 [Ceratobasidium sp. 428]|nr:hypothetical protein FRC12_006133 [Ceratobasidium sp. 428]